MTTHIERWLALLVLVAARPAVVSDEDAPTTQPSAASAAERFADSVMDADFFAYENLLAFEVLSIESVPQTGERIRENWYRSEDIHLAKCRVTASIYGPLPAGEVFYVLVPTWPMWGDTIADVDRFLTHEDSVFFANLWDAWFIRTWASEQTRASVEELVGPTTSLYFKGPLHRLGGGGRVDILPYREEGERELDFGRESGFDFAAAVRALEARVAELTPRIVFGVSNYGGSRWSAVVGPDSVLRVTWRWSKRSDSQVKGSRPIYEWDEGATETPLNAEQLRRVQALLADFAKLPAELSVSGSKMPDDTGAHARVFTGSQQHGAQIWALRESDVLPDGAELFYELAKAVGVCDLDLWGVHLIEAIHERTLKGRAAEISR